MDTIARMRLCWHGRAVGTLARMHNVLVEADGRGVACFGREGNGGCEDATELAQGLVWLEQHSKPAQLCIH